MPTMSMAWSVPDESAMRISAARGKISASFCGTGTVIEVH